GRRLIIAEQVAVDPPRTQVVLIDTTLTGSGAAETLMTLPANVVPGSESWDPQGKWMAFVSRSKASDGATVGSLSAIEARLNGSFRYIADLGSIQPIPDAQSI